MPDRRRRGPVLGGGLVIGRRVRRALGLTVLLGGVVLAVAGPAAAAPASPAVDTAPLVVLEHSERCVLSKSARDMEWQTREVIVCRRATKLADPYRFHGLVNSFGFKATTARLVRSGADGRRRTWSLDDYVASPFLPGESFISDAELNVLSMPALVAGDTLTREYTLRLDPFLGFPVFVFGDAAVPVLHSTLEVRVPTELSPRFIGANGAPEPVATDEGPTRVLRWEIGRVDPPADDATAGSPQDHNPTVSIGVDRIAWGASSSWTEIAGSYWKELMRRLGAEACGALEQPTREDPRPAAAAALARVQADVRYVAIALGPGGLIPHPPHEVSRRGFGDCKDMALLMCRALRARGVDAAVALVGTRPPAGRRLDPLPTLRAFNHAICFVPTDAGGAWLDATDNYGTIDSPRPDIQGAPALVLTGPAAGYHRIPVMPAEQNQLQSRVELKRIDSTSGRLDITLRFTGIAADWIKHRLASQSSLVEGDLTPLPPELLPVAGAGVVARPFRVERLAANRVELRGEADYDPNGGWSSGRASGYLPWRPAPGPLSTLPAQATTPLDFDWPRVYADTLVLAGGSAWCAPPDSLPWRHSAGGASVELNAAAAAQDWVLTRTVRLDSVCYGPAEQPALKALVLAMKRHNVISLKTKP